jgi:hypothetical protein
LVMAACAAALPNERFRPDSVAVPSAKNIPASAQLKPATKTPASGKTVQKPPTALERPREIPSEETGRTPTHGPRPDSSFARASDWETGETEILTYTVKHADPVGGKRAQGRLLTERMFLRPDGTAARAPETASGGPTETEILNAILWEKGGEEDPFSTETVSQFSRARDFALLRQEQGLLGRHGATHRSLDCRAQPPRLRIASGGGEASLDTLLTRWPVYTEEMLFTYLRAIPLRPGYREEVWLQDWGREGRFRLLPRYASITVSAKASGVRDVDTWYVIVDRDDGGRSQFWIGASGLHPVIVAELSDGTEWILQGTSRKKFR